MGENTQSHLVKTSLILLLRVSTYRLFCENFKQWCVFTLTIKIILLRDSGVLQTGTACEQV